MGWGTPPPEKTKTPPGGGGGPPHTPPPPAAGGRVWAVGTTTLRTLESVVQPDRRVVAGSGETRIFIRPPATVRSVDALVTNFHLPRSTLLMLVAAFAGYELTMRAYAAAVAERYRFYSYGDAMAIV